MQSIDARSFKELDNRLAALLKDMPGLKREAHERIAAAFKREVDAQIVASGINDSNSKIRGWQDKSVGSGGGYAAVRAIPGLGPGRSPKQQYANSPGAITNYLENGHKLRTLAVGGKRKSRARSQRVPGYHFYHASKSRAEAIAIAEANALTDEIAGRLGS